MTALEWLEGPGQEADLRRLPEQAQGLAAELWVVSLSEAWRATCMAPVLLGFHEYGRQAMQYRDSKARLLQARTFGCVAPA